MNDLIAWREDQRKFYQQVIVDFALPVSSTTEVRMEQMLNDTETNIRDVLRDGLDIGTIARHITPVILQKHPDHGWVFCTDNGAMYPVRDHIRGR